MRVVFVFQDILWWITPYKTLADVPEHPIDDLYVEAPEEAQEGWIFGREKWEREGVAEFSPPPEPETTEPIIPLEVRLSDVELGLKFVESVLVVNGQITLDDVLPNSWRDEVEGIVQTRRFER